MMQNPQGKDPVADYLKKYGGATPAPAPSSDPVSTYLAKYGGQTGDIDLSKPRPGEAVVSSGPITGVGVDAETIARAKAGEFGLSKAIDATQALDYPRTSRGLESPDDVRGQLASIGKDVRKRTAPGLASTAANVALSHMADPLSNQMGDAATEAAIDRYLEGGKGMSTTAANVLGAAAFGGNVAGNVGVGKAIGTVAKGVGAVAGEVSPTVGRVLNASRAGRVASHALSGGVSNAALRATGSAIEGHDLPTTAREAASAGAQGAVMGGLLGVLVEAPGLTREAKQLAQRMFGGPEPVDPVEVRTAYLAKLSPADRTYLENEPQLRDAIFPEKAAKAGPGPIGDDGPSEPPHGTPPSPPEPPPQGGSPLSMNDAGFYGDFGNATVRVEPGTKLEGEGALDTVSAVKQAVETVGRDEFRARVQAEAEKRGSPEDPHVQMAATEQVARDIATAGRTDLFGNALPEKVEQGGLFGERESLNLAQNEGKLREAKALARKDATISADEMAERRDELGAPRSGTEASPAPRRALALHDSARDPQGALRPLHRVSDHGLVREYGEQVAKMEEYERRGLYHYTQDDNFHSTEDGRTVVSASRSGPSAITDQAKAATNKRNAIGVLNKIEAELTRRGLSADPADLMARHEEMQAERAGMQEEAGVGANEDPEFRFAGPGLLPTQRAALRRGYRSALVTPYADIEGEAPDLVAALHKGGAANARALHIASRRTSQVLAGLSDEQQAQFGRKLTADNLRAEAQRKAASDPQAAQRFDAHATQLEQSLPQGIEQQPWFQQALAKHRQYVEQPLTEAALQAGVDPSSLRQPSSAYLRLVSNDRLTDTEIRRAMDAAGVDNPSDLKPAGPIRKALVGEKPAVARVFPRGTQGFRQGPLQPNAGYPGESVPNRKGTSATGSSKQAQGTAREYATDYTRIVAADATDKAVRAARNNVYAEVAKIGRELQPGEAPAPGKTVIAFTDSKGIATGDTGAQRFEVTKNVRDAVTRFHQTLEAKPTSSAGRALEKISGGLTQAQLSGMPVEATSHANTIASIVGSVPGEKDALGKGLTIIPGVGAKLAAIREMAELDFSDPQTIALEHRLADIGALRVEEGHGGVLNSAHRWLFGPEGVDVRGRLVLARKYLARTPDATDEALREFVTSKLGNYVPANSGTAVNALQGTGVTAFARFQAARIPGSVRTVFGVSDLPAHSGMQRAGDIANTLYRGPVGHLVGTNALNYALTGHSTFENEKGHSLDVDLGTTIGPKDRPVFVPGTTINPVVTTGLRASGLRSLLMSDRTGTQGRIADAERDVANVGLGTLSPAARFAFTAATGRIPYLGADNDFPKTVASEPNRDRQSLAQLEAALSQANPAVHAFAGSGGDLQGRSLADALSEDGQPFGGPKATTARIAEFLMPRVASAGIGGPDQAMSATMRDRMEYQAAVKDAVREVENAAGPEDAQQVAQKWLARFRAAGYETQQLAAQLRKAQNTPEYARDMKRQGAAKRFQHAHPRNEP
jgi:hypothetical protein